MEIVCYYPLTDRLTADLFRDWLLMHCPDSRVGALTDYLTDNHPLPHFRATLIDTDTQKAQAQLSVVSATLSIRILGQPDHWMGRTLDLR